jgi:ABC-type transport system involved in Fe-S cluster assembly fused permease/ATPase subunit
MNTKSIEVFILAFVTMLFFFDIPLLVIVPLMIVSLFSSILFSHWRTKYRRLLQDAKAVAFGAQAQMLVGKYLLQLKSSL